MARPFTFWVGPQRIATIFGKLTGPRSLKLFCVDICSLSRVDADELSKLYADRDELPSKHLDTIAEEVPAAQGSA